MSTVKGFNTTLGVLKYDAESLDNYNTPLFDFTSTYEVGDYVIEDGKLYRCITDVPTAGSWSSVSSNFVAAILTDDIKGIKEDVDDLSTNFSTLEGNVGTLENNVQTLSSDVGTLSTNVNSLTTSVGKINNSIALTFNTSTSYAIGDYVLYEGSLYRFTATHAAGAWISTDAVQVQLAEDVRDMVIISDTEPTSDANKIWVNSDSTSVQVPTTEELNDLIDAVFPTKTLSNQTVASFTDGAKNIPVKSIEVAIEPTQNLNGYNNPWPAGGGKNLFDSSLLTDAGWTEVNGVYTGSSADIKQSVIPNFLKVPIPAGQRITVSFDVLNDNVDRAGYFWILYDDSSKDFVECPANASAWTHKTKTSASGKNVSEVYFGMSNSVNFSLKNIQIEYGTSETSFAPYSNICPISGWTECKVTRVGKNIFDAASWASAINGASFENDTLSGTINGFYSNPYVFSKEDVKATFSFDSYSGTATNVRAQLLSSDNTVVGTLNLSSDTHITATASKIRLNYSSAGTVSIVKPQIEISSTVSSYEPYQGQTYTIDLDGTRYGGTLDVTSGKLTVDRVIKVFDGTEDFNLINDASRRFIFRNLPALGTSNETTVVQKGLISHGVFQNSWSGAWGHFRLNSGTYLGFLDKGTYFASVSDLQTYLASEYTNETPVQVVYPLATPIEVQLTPTQVTTLYLANNFSSESGKISLTYRADLASYIAEAVGGA